MQRSGDEEMSIELKDFVANALEQIAAGVVAAAANETDDAAAPRIAGPFKMDGGINHPVQFDIAVQVSDSEEKSGGGGFKIAVLKVDGQISSAEQSTTGHRIQFAVPMQYPSAQYRRSR